VRKVARFGGDEDKPDDLARIEASYGSEVDVLEVQKMPYDRIRSIMALWLAGASFADIAMQFNMRSPALARVAVERALSESVDDTQDRSKLRQKMTLTLDRLLRSVMAKAVDGESPDHLAAVRTALSIVDRKIRLHGLDAPLEHVVHYPENEEFERVIAMMAQTQGMMLPDEGDPFAEEIEDAEVVEDDDAG